MSWLLVSGASPNEYVDMNIVNIRQDSNYDTFFVTTDGLFYVPENSFAEPSVVFKFIYKGEVLAGNGAAYWIASSDVTANSYIKLTATGLELGFEDSSSSTLSTNYVQPAAGDLFTLDITGTLSSLSATINGQSIGSISAPSVGVEINRLLNNHNADSAFKAKTHYIQYYVVSGGG
jgi:hypothetical protein